MLDPIVVKAIEQAVRTANQPNQLAEKIVSWMSSLAQGTDSLENKDDVSQRIELLYNSTIVDVSKMDEDHFVTTTDLRQA